MRNRRLIKRFKTQNYEENNGRILKRIIQQFMAAYIGKDTAKH